MNIIQRMLFREVFKTLTVILFVLLLVVIASHFVKLLGKAADGSLSTDVLLMMVGFQAIKVVGILLPPAFFFSLLWVLGGMYRDGEMVALQSGGIGTVSILRSVMLLALPLSLVTAAWVLYLVPWSNAQVEHIKFAQQDKSDISGVRPGRFNEFNGGNLVVYSRGVDPESGELLDVFVQDRQQGQSGVVVSEQAFQTIDPNTGERFIILADGRRYEGQPSNAAYEISRYAEYAIRMPEVDLAGKRLRLAAQSSFELWQDDRLSSRAELQYRFSVPIAVLLFALLAIPLARSQPRRDVYGRMGLAVLVYFIFMNLQRVAERWMELSTTPAWLGMWWLSVVMLLVAGMMYFLDSNWLAAKIRSVRSGKAPA